MNIYICTCIYIYIYIYQVDARGLLKLADFGLACEKKGVYIQTRSNLAGTPRYYLLWVSVCGVVECTRACIVGSVCTVRVGVRDGVRAPDR